ncbi:glycosyltransferase [Phenylobacterium sp. J367]|uniref:glycosyltransferase n=1 Tax=Phenylobacterium sp. J367 TaxID=2898435 RepID=UPI0021518EB8|nr:glycosyltransferase [Phenylobacterium sp. J367]MCR5878440.1 glycosyltransferase [Phenylobacterium sp. J367]
MTRIVYLGFPQGEVTGGQKMILRHVETLRDLGFDAIAWNNPENVPAPGLDHRAPVEVGTAFRAADILVVPDDAPRALAQASQMVRKRSVVFCQSAISLASVGAPSIDHYPAERFPPFITVAPGVAGAIRRIYPQADVHVVPAFADERLFQPGNQRRNRIVVWPKKRPAEARAIRSLLPRLHPQSALPFVAIDKAPERDMARAFASSTVFLSLARMESLGITPLEAMASGCVVAGFTGIGGRDFATPENGFWVEEDNVFAATDALAAACDLVRRGGPDLVRMWEAGRATAEAWSYARFRVRLEETWMTLAPEARLKDGPLD